MKTTVDDLSKAIQKTLAEYEGVTIDSMKSAVDKASKEAVRELKGSSPRRSGAYAKSWTSKKTKLTKKWAYEKTVYNKEHYRLTHLLEKGHKVVGAKNGRTWVDARPHIEKVEQKAVETLLNEMKETL